MNSPPRSGFAGRFSEWEPLGRGAEGQLFRVMDRWTGRACALKVASDPTGREALAHEFALLSTLRHPCLIRSLDLVRDGDTWGHLLQYVPAVEPETVWDLGGEEAVLAALTQAHRGLAYLHRAGWVHGDVSPGNILVWKDGTSWRAKVADLGLTLPLDAAREAGVRGTPGTMAPETARGEGCSPASDLYGLAATAITWIDKASPWDGVAVEEILRRTATGESVPAPARRVGDDLGSSIKGLGASEVDRRAWRGASLREPVVSGPRVDDTTRQGLEPVIQEQMDRVLGAEASPVSGIVVRGRTGVGRRTLAVGMVRRLVSAGWSAFWNPPYDTVADWLAGSTEAPDPVAIVRKLGERFRGQDVAVYWPHTVTGIQARLLRAFVSEGTGGARRLVIKTAPVDSDDDARWLEGVMPVSTLDWSGPPPEAMNRLLTELTAEDGGTHVDAGSFSTPRALMQWWSTGAKEPVDSHSDADFEASLAREAGTDWQRWDALTRRILFVLAVSSHGLGVDELTACVDAPESEVSARLAEVDRFYVVVDQGGLWPRYRVPDPLVADALRQVADASTRAAAAGGVGAAAREARVPADLGLLDHLIDAGEVDRDYVVRTLTAGIHQGQPEAVIALVRSLVALETPVGNRLELLGLGLEAAEALREFSVQLEFLRAMLGSDGIEAETAGALRRKLIKVLEAVGRWEDAVREANELGETAEGETRVWAKLEAAEALWQSGEFDKADAAYGEVEGEAIRADSSLTLKYYVGRSRESGQRGHFESMGAILEEAREKLGVSVCESDPLYLHGTAGYMLETGRNADAYRASSRARHLAEQRAAWTDYAMISTRSAAAINNLGNFRESVDVASEALRIAVANKSDRHVHMVSLFLASFEIGLGLFGNARRRLEYVLSQAGTDKVLSYEAVRLRAYLAALSSMGDRVEDDCAYIERHGGDSGRAFASQYKAWLSLESSDSPTIRECFAKAVDHLERVGRKDNAAVMKATVALVKAGDGDVDEARLDFESVSEFLESDQYIKFRPIGRIIGTELGYYDECWESFQELTDQGRSLDLVHWGAEILRNVAPENSLPVKRQLVAALKSITNSIDDLDWRREYLQSRAVKKLLTCVR